MAAALALKAKAVSEPLGSSPAATGSPGSLTAGGGGGGLKKTLAAGPVKIGPVRAAPKVWGGEDAVPEPLRIFMFGKFGTGKTYSLLSLLLAGYKVYYVSTDMGGLGVRSFMAQLRTKYPHLLKNIRGLSSIETIADMTSFLYNPAKLDPGIWDFDPDFMMWDGYSNFQQVMITDEMYGAEEAKLEDRITENKEWSKLKNASINSLTRFCRIANPVTGKIIHKIVVSHEDIRNSKSEMGTLPSADGIELYVPWFQGSGKQQIMGAFDVSIRTGRDKKKLDINEGYRYYLSGPFNKMPKRRGEAMKKLGDEIPADLMTIVGAIFDEENITKDMVDPLNKELMAASAAGLEQALAEEAAVETETAPAEPESES